MKNPLEIMALKTIILSIVLLCTSDSNAQSGLADLPNKIDDLFKDYATHNQPGVVVGVLQNDSIIFTKAYGLADVENKIPITADTRFHIASLTKQFTAYAIARLKTEGKLSYDDDIRTYIPGLYDFGKPITINHLIHHSSGLRSTNRLRLLQDEFYEPLLTQKNALDLIYAQRELNFEPGTDFSYSNAGYILLATIVENITRKKFSLWLKQNVFDPLKMNHTILLDKHIPTMPGRAIPYEKKDDRFVQTMGMRWNDYGATGIYSNINDLMKWQAHLHTQNYMWFIDEPGRFPYAMGLYVLPGAGGSTEKIFHTGDGVGYTSYMAYYPTEKTDVIVLSNLNSNEPIDLGENIIRFMHPVKEYTGTKNHIEVPLEVLKNYEGSYDAKQFIATFEIRDKSLYALNPQGADLLVALNDTSFSIPNTPVVFEFAKNGDHVILKIPGNDIQCLKIIPEIKTPSGSLTGYPGSYYSPELNVAYDVKVEDGQLVAYSPGQRRIVLPPVIEDKTETRDRYFRVIHFSRDVDHIVNGMRVTDIDGRVSNLWFEKKK